MRPIDADEFECITLKDCSDEFAKGAKYILEMIDKAPTVTRHGHWIVSSDVPDSFVCSECGHKYDMYKHEMSEFRCCPWCKAEMEEE